MLPLEKRILRSTLELVGSFLALWEFCTEHFTQAGAVLLSVLSSVTSSHLTEMGFKGSCPQVLPQLPSTPDLVMCKRAAAVKMIGASRLPVQRAPCTTFKCRYMNPRAQGCPVQSFFSRCPPAHHKSDTSSVAAAVKVQQLSGEMQRVGSRSLRELLWIDAAFAN
jgi:hypothetical protein